VIPMRDSLPLATSVHDEGWRASAYALVTHVEPAGEVAVAARTALLAGLAVWSLRFFAHALDPVYLIVLLGGRTGAEVEGHDWEAILSALGWLRYDILLGRLANLLGIVLMIVALAWGASVVVRQRAQAARS
jgi:hypothetical protein